MEFAVWAPTHASIGLRLEGSGDAGDLPMQPGDGGWHMLRAPVAAVGTRYRFVLPDDTALPDPASRCQPEGAFGPSEVVDLGRHVWRHPQWKGRPWHEAVICELHVGTFTQEGTFRAAIDRLAHLAALGVTAVELMPVATFAGERNWGYDGVLPFAPAAPYGRPEDLQAFVDAAHGLGIMVLLDVVYNHFGPEGSAMHALAPKFFTERHHTPWGAGFNFEEQPAVRHFFIDNALHWLEAYRIDGLRLDAVHEIQDDSTEHIVDAIASAVWKRFPDRHVHLILENEHNEAHRLVRRNGKLLRYTAQWNDDVHHTLHVAATGESTGYYADYLGDMEKLGRSLAEGFAFQGEHMPYSGRRRGEPSARLPPLAFISFLQNHDQVGNRAFGDRLSTLAPPHVLRALASIQLLLPQVPMLFMGEEWGTRQPFPFFCDFHGELKQAVVKGRREEFARFPEFSDPAKRDQIPDPTSEETFATAKLRWEELEQPEAAEQLAFTRALLEVRRREIVPMLPRTSAGGEYLMQGPLVQVRWQAGDAGWLMLRAHLSSGEAEVSAGPTRRVIWQHGECDESRFGPWAVEWSVDTARQDAS